MRNKTYVISDCCNGYVRQGWTTVQDILDGTVDYYCKVCGKKCTVKTRPAYREKFQGVFEEIKYNR